MILANFFHGTRERLQRAAASLLIAVSEFCGFLLLLQFPAIAAVEAGSLLSRLAKRDTPR
jgi:hypothetical protein